VFVFSETGGDVPGEKLDALLRRESSKLKSVDNSEIYLEKID